MRSLTGQKGKIVSGMKRAYSLIVKLNQPSVHIFQIYKMMEECWSLDPAQRPTFAQLLNFLSEYSMESGNIWGSCPQTHVYCKHKHLKLDCYNTIHSRWKTNNLVILCDVWYAAESCVYCKLLLSFYQQNWIRYVGLGLFFPRQWNVFASCLYVRVHHGHASWNKNILFSSLSLRVSNYYPNLLILGPLPPQKMVTNEKELFSILDTAS